MLFLLVFSVLVSLSFVNGEMSIDCRVNGCVVPGFICDIQTGACNPDLCIGVTCGEDYECHSNDGQCYYIGPKGCESVICDETTVCVPGAPGMIGTCVSKCLGVGCPTGTSCEATSGACKTSEELCVGVTCQTNYVCSFGYCLPDCPPGENCLLSTEGPCHLKPICCCVLDTYGLPICFEDGLFEGCVYDPWGNEIEVWPGPSVEEICSGWGIYETKYNYEGYCGAPVGSLALVFSFLGTSTAEVLSSIDSWLNSGTEYCNPPCNPDEQCDKDTGRCIPRIIPPPPPTDCTITGCNADEYCDKDTGRCVTRPTPPPPPPSCVGRDGSECDLGDNKKGICRGGSCIPL